MSPTLRNIVVDGETAARWREAPEQTRAQVLHGIGEQAKRADRQGRPGLADAARDAVMLLTDVLRAAAEPATKEEIIEWKSEAIKPLLCSLCRKPVSPFEMERYGLDQYHAECAPSRRRGCP